MTFCPSIKKVAPAVATMSPAVLPGTEGQYAMMQTFVQDANTLEIVLTGTTTYVLLDDVF